MSIAPYGSTLPEEGSIGRGHALISNNKRVQFLVDYNGDLLLLADGKELWSFKGKNALFVKMQGDGNCCGYTTDGPMWSTGTNGRDHPYKLVCQDDGNLVVYNKDGPAWATNTGGRVPSKPSFVSPYGSTLHENSIIGRGYALTSDNKRVQFQVDYNGDLLLHGDGKELWSFKGKNANFVKMQDDGNCCGYTSDGPMWATGTDGRAHPYKLVCQDDGNLVVYNKDGPAWATNTGGKVH